MDNSIDQKKQVLEIKSDKGIKYISQNRILYIRGENRGSDLFLNNSEKINTKHLLKWYENILMNPEFFRCHNSYIINCRFFDYLCGNEIVLKGQIRIPLSRHRKELLKEKLILIEEGLL